MNGVAPTHQRPSIEEDYPDPPRRAKTTSRIYTEAKPTRRLERTRFHWLVFVGLGLFVMIIGWLSFSALSNWWSTKVNDWTYGNPRTYQVDAVVGHNDSPAHPSHFIAVNLNGKIEVIEIPGGDPSKSQIYIGPQLFGAGSDLTPVTLSFEDCSGSGKVDVPDMELHIQGSDKLICFPNNGKTFTSTSGQH